MQKYLPAILLVVISLGLWAFLFTYLRSSGKNMVLYFKQLSEKYGLVYDDTNRSGGKIYPLVKGVYKNRHAAIGCFTGGNSKDVSTYVRVECSNPKGLGLIITKKKKNSPSSGADTVNMMDTEFDEQFIVKSSLPDKVFPIFSFNIKYSLVQAQNLGFRGTLKLENNLLDYTEPEMMKEENARTRIELIMHILCDMADELEKQ